MITEFDHSDLHIYVDVVERGKALVTVAGVGGLVRRDGKKFYVEADDETSLGTVWTYEQGARRIASHYGYGLRSLIVEVDKEY